MKMDLGLFEIYIHKITHVNINDPNFPCGIRYYQVVAWGNGFLRIPPHCDAKNKPRRRLARNEAESLAFSLT